MITRRSLMRGASALALAPMLPIPGYQFHTYSTLIPWGEPQDIALCERIAADVFQEGIEEMARMDRVRALLRIAEWSKGADAQ